VEAWVASPSSLVIIRSERMPRTRRSVGKEADMTKLELSADEAKVLTDVLSNYVSDLRMEIADTDSKDYREKLKKKEELLKNLVTRLGGKAE
jgi:hypothetical protein